MADVVVYECDLPRRNNYPNFDGYLNTQTTIKCQRPTCFYYVGATFLETMNNREEAIRAAFLQRTQLDNFKQVARVRRVVVQENVELQTRAELDTLCEGVDTLEKANADLAQSKTPDEKMRPLALKIIKKRESRKRGRSANPRDPASDISALRDPKVPPSKVNTASKKPTSKPTSRTNSTDAQPAPNGGMPPPPQQPSNQPPQAEQVGGKELEKP